jgi:regulator of replication initiation timing
VISKTQRLEQEILEVYNESTKLRAEMQGLHEENSRQKARICDLENTLDRMGPIQSECENAKNVSE